MDGLVKSGMVGMVWFDGMVGMPYYTALYHGVVCHLLVWYGMDSYIMVHVPLVRNVKLCFGW